MIKAIDLLEENLRPPYSKKLHLENEIREIRRLRIGKWRILYLALDEQAIILGLRQRPPYNYEDIQQLIQEIE